MPATIETAVACGICDGRMSEADLELGREGSFGRICGRCVAIVERECDECGMEGVHGVGIGPFYGWRMFIREAWEHEMLLGVRIAHPQWPHAESRFVARTRADAIAGRIVANVPLSAWTTWGLDATETVRIHRTHDGEWLCEECSDACWECGDTFPLGEIVDDLCDHCRMPQCRECGERWEFESDADNCCGSGMECVHEWDFRPAFRFWMTDADGTPYWASGHGWRPSPPSDALFIGIELETEKGADAFPAFLANAGEDWEAPSFAYGKRDGSLCEDTGVELVTMPATLDAFQKVFPWDALAAWNNAGARSFHMGTCGFHVHVSRSHFSPTHLWRFVAWQMRNQSFCERLGQRDNSRWARWQTLGEFREHGKALADVVKGKANNGERYVAINFQNAETVELRYFRGNLRPEAIRTRVEFVDALAAFTREMSASDVVAGALSVPNFAEFVRANIHRYATLATWIADNENEWEDK